MAALHRPDLARLRRAAPALAGLLAGAFATIMLAAFASVLYTGTGIGQDIPRQPPVYTVF
ncbi:MAG: hypothetical protein GW905_04995 [Rhodobacterales bacterium]|nr:hypothetical protein [Rhodobacterales bacterium]